MRRIKGSCQVHVLAESAIRLLAAVHATLALLPSGERLGSQLDAQLASRFPGCVVLHGGRRLEQGLPEQVHCRGEALGDGPPKPREAGPDDAVTFAVAVRETAPLRFKWRLKVGGARHHARLQRRGHLVVHRPERSGQRHAANVETIHANDAAVVQLAHQ